MVDDQGAEVRLTCWVRGQVQGVGFRWWTRSRALELGLAGWARNCSDGRVEIVAEGPRTQCDRLLVVLSGANAPGEVSGVVTQWTTATSGITGFTER